MLFDESVKEKLEDFFNRDEEIDLLRNAIITGRKLILVLGIRRIGKSSLIRVVLNSMKIPYLYFDIRAVYHKYHSITNYSLYQLLETNINNIIKSNLWSRIGDYLKRIKEISIAGVRVRFNKKINQYFPLFYRIFNAIDEWCTGEGKKAVIVFDEAQYLRFSRFNFRGLFAYIYDNLKNLSLILSGSEVGLLHDFLKIDDAKSELYGRYYYALTLRNLTREQAINFLKKGFEEYDIHPSKSFLREAADLLDGIIGWLVFFGRLCIDRNLVNKKEAIKEVIIQGSKLIRSELGELFSRSKRYKHILEAISLGRKKWSEIKSYLISRELQPISDTALYNLLSNLKKMGIIEKKYVDEEIIYEIVDPIIKYTISLGYNN